MSTATHLLITAFLITFTVSLASLPKEWKTCSVSSPDRDDCFKREISHALKTLMDGNKKLGVLGLDPLRINSLEIPKNPGPVNINLMFKNLDVKGLKKLEVTKMKNDWKTIEAQAKVPTLYVLGDYKVDGKVLVLPITGEGKCNLTFDVLDVNVKAAWMEMEKGGKKYLQVEKFNLELIPKRLYIHLSNLFNGDKALGENMNTFLNENWDQILAELKPGITSALSQAFTLYSNNVLSKIPKDEIVKK